MFSDNLRKRLERVEFFKKYEESIFPLIVFEISVMENDSITDISKTMSGKIDSS